MTNHSSSPPSMVLPLKPTNQGNPLDVVFPLDEQESSILILAQGGKLFITHKFYLSETISMHPGKGDKLKVDIFTTDIDIFFATEQPRGF
ncbi:hypothetical protein BDV33DRAFT_176105 [Aspergillus novoparasiticus]|uniref:Uncharacterized protein n=1 Tax=Aspergillus novoparasiticus TaxID=986946 RepID=A0A5N6EMS1_9EURO|nr:hypothetical protein BDV33DRAFT_176105 [Aspergillus novoparasiticus]